MKRILLFTIALISFQIASRAQTKALETIKISTPTVGCESCKARIEEYLKRYDGVTYVNVNWRKKETIVKFLTARTNKENIKAAIANAGYDADEYPANPDVYKKLPKTCQHPAGGGAKINNQ